MATVQVLPGRKESGAGVAAGGRFIESERAAEPAVAPTTVFVNFGGTEPGCSGGRVAGVGGGGGGAGGGRGR